MMLMRLIDSFFHKQESEFHKGRAGPHSAATAGSAPGVPRLGAEDTADFAHVEKALRYLLQRFRTTN